ncbi:hypothetical protein ACIRPK_09395 [Kitasatospora sp. NPDC101801]|uniref:hypothetical protein n=1 Tax=Kitasatospora sp. NPDC101801 TaxID=3364103 RepID=UPI0038004A0D
MRKTFRSAIALGFAAASLVLGTVSAEARSAPPTSQGDFAGCRTGWVCIYADASWNSRIVYQWQNYGAHNLANMEGAHRVFNNQTGGAVAYLCLGYGASNCPGGNDVQPWEYWDTNLSPINSVWMPAP